MVWSAIPDIATILPWSESLDNPYLMICTTFIQCASLQVPKNQTSNGIKGACVTECGVYMIIQCFIIIVVCYYYYNFNNIFTRGSKDPEG